MTATRWLRPTALPHALAGAASIASITLAVLVLGACGSSPYAADAGSATTPSAGGGAPGSTGRSEGAGAGGPSTGPSPRRTLPVLPDMPTDPAMTHGPLPDPDAPVSATDQPGQTLSAPAVAGRVTDAAGRPVSGLLVSVVSHGDPMVAVPEIGVLTGSDGRYAWPSLPPGPWEVRVSRDGRTASVQVTLEAGRTTTADLVLR